MRFAWLWLVLVACGEPAPPLDGMPGDPALPRDCPRACRPGEEDCASFPYERLPARCQDICHLGGRGELVSGAWSMRFVDCARPADAGIDAVPDGAPDA